MISMNTLGNYGLLGLLMAVLLAGCDSDGRLLIGRDDGLGATNPGSRLGPVAGFSLDGVIVNDRAYGTLGTEFLINDISASQAGLDKGMLVILDVGEDNLADRIIYEDDLRGPLLADEFDPLTQTLQVLGQRVRFNNATVFHGRWSLDEIPLLFALGNNLAFVTVSGWYLDSGDFLASYVRASQFSAGALGDLRLHGMITAVDPAARTLRIGNLTVQYGQNTAIDMGGRRDRILVTDSGRFVEVEGFLNQLGGNFTARQVEVEDRAEALGGIRNDRILIEGVVTRAVRTGSNQTLAVSGIPVQVDSDTELQDLQVADLQQGRRVLMEGVGEADAKVLAERILDREPEAEVRAIIDTIAPSLDDPNRAGRMMVGGVRVEVLPGTIVVDSETDLENFTIQFGDLMPGEFVEVAGVRREDREGQYLEAVKVERDLPFDDARPLD